MTDLEVRLEALKQAVVLGAALEETQPEKLVLVAKRFADYLFKGQ